MTASIVIALLEKGKRRTIKWSHGVCFECAFSGQVHQHHVVPKSLGGTRTVPLCESCHGKVHGIDLTDHGVLIRIGLEKARLRGARLGRSPGKEKPNTFLTRHSDIVRLLQKGKSIRDVAALTKKSSATVLKVRQLVKS